MERWLGGEGCGYLCYSNVSYGPTLKVQMGTLHGDTKIHRNPASTAGSLNVKSGLS